MDTVTENVGNESLVNQYIFVRVFHVQVHLTQNGNLIVSVALRLFITWSRTASKGLCPHVLQICQRLISVLGDT
jgi:hypothetical protein